MSIAVEILKQDSLTEIKTHAQALTSRRDDLANQLGSRKMQLQALRQKLVDNGLGQDVRVEEIDAWLNWIDSVILELPDGSSIEIEGIAEADAEWWSC